MTDEITTIRDILGEPDRGGLCFCRRRPATVWHQHQTKPDDLIHCCAACHFQGLAICALGSIGAEIFAHTIDAAEAQNFQRVAHLSDALTMACGNAAIPAGELLEAFDAMVKVLDSEIQATPRRTARRAVGTPA